MTFDERATSRSASGLYLHSYFKDTKQITSFPLLLERALPTWTQVERGTSESKSGTTDDSSNSENLDRAAQDIKQIKSNS